jgi:S1-C subfamily serine protease
MPPTAIEAAFGNMPQGEKFVTPGDVLDVRPDLIRYEAFTTNGMSGGAVVDLATGRVIGLHLGGRFDAGVKYGFAVPMSFLQPMLRGEIERFDRKLQSAGRD